MEQEENIELRSEDVEEILGTPPSWLVQWGTTVVLLCFGILLFTGWMIRYPDVIGAKVVLTTAVPPVDVVARTEGHIAKLLVQDNLEVTRGKVLVVLQSTSRYEDVMQLDQSVSEWQQTPVDSFAFIEPLMSLEIGELQTDYSIFIQNLKNFQFGKGDKSASVASNVSATQQQIDRLEKSIEYDKKSKDRALKQLETEREMHGNLKKLFDQGLISRVEYERERTKLADAERQFDLADESILRKQSEIISLRKSIGEVRFGEKETEASAFVRLRESLNSLRSSVDKWKQTYLLTAPIDGRVSLNSSFFSEQQYVKQGDQVLAIVPPTSEKIIGRLYLPVAGSGKVKSGQRVVLKLESYPHYEFGAIEGIVESKALVPKDNQYAILVSLPHGLKTNFGRTIPFEQQLQGQAEIVTEDKRFLQRIADQVFASSH